MTAPNASTMEEIEQALAEPPKAPGLSEIKLEGDNIPEDLRGKSVEELVRLADGLSRSLKLSEQARLTIQPQAPPPPPPPKEEPELTDEQLAELHSQDPVKAIRYMQQQAIRAAERNVESRLAPLAYGTTSAVENAARQKYAEEFEVLGTEISQLISQLPNKSVLSDPKAWDDVVSYVRGQHFNKMFDYRTQKAALKARETAQAGAIDAAGMSFAPSGGVSPSGGPVVIDDYTKEIARNLNMSPEDYVKWSKI